MNKLRLLVAGLLALVLTAPAQAQEAPRKKPVLVRRDATADATAEPEIVTPDPNQAREHLEVGNFYFRRGNYKAAADRYREAVKYGPKNAEAYERLIRSLEKLDDFEGALKVCDDFIQVNPDSAKVQDFEKKADQLRTKAKPG